MRLNLRRINHTKQGSNQEASTPPPSRSGSTTMKHTAPLQSTVSRIRRKQRQSPRGEDRACEAREHTTTTPRRLGAGLPMPSGSSRTTRRPRRCTDGRFGIPPEMPFSVHHGMFRLGLMAAARITQRFLPRAPPVTPKNLDSCPRLRVE